MSSIIRRRRGLISAIGAFCLKGGLQQHHPLSQGVKLYEQAALNALEAGFDGVEIHAANGYLVN
jgi:hypothetical protein